MLKAIEAVTSVTSCNWLYGKTSSQFHNKYRLLCCLITSICDLINLLQYIHDRSAYTVRSFFTPVICHCVTFTLLPPCPGTGEWLWLGGRKSDNNVWVWDHSRQPIDGGLWRPGKPDGTASENRVFFAKSHGMDDFRGTHTIFFLCEAASNTPAC